MRGRYSGRGTARLAKHRREYDHDLPLDFAFLHLSEQNRGHGPFNGFFNAAPQLSHRRPSKSATVNRLSTAFPTFPTNAARPTFSTPTFLTPDRP